MATVRNLACIAFRPEALDVHSLYNGPKKTMKMILKNEKGGFRVRVEPHLLDLHHLIILMWRELL